MKGLRKQQFVAFEIQAIRDAWHSKISPILLATRLFPLQVKHVSACHIAHASIKIAPPLKFILHTNYNA